MAAKNRESFVWGQHVAVAGAYAACYELTRNFSFSHWMLPAGLRLACLLLVPRRFWPALAVGEALPVGEMALMHARLFGTLWAVLISIPTIMFTMPAVAGLQRLMSLRRADGQINMAFILLATLAGALVTSTVNCIDLSTVDMGDGSPAPAVTARIFMVYLLGAYLGALALTPTIMALHDRIRSQPAGALTARSVLGSALTRDVLFIAAPVLLVLMALAQQLTGGALQCVRFAMAIPVFVLTWRHGWHGTATGGLLASIAMAAGTFELLDPAMIQAQTVLSFAISTSLLFGVRVARRLAIVQAESIRAAAAGHPHG